MAYSNQAKNTAEWLEQSYGSGDYILTASGEYLLTAEPDKIGVSHIELDVYTDETKNTSSWSNQAKN